MASSLSVRNIDDDLITRLKMRAARHDTVRAHDPAAKILELDRAVTVLELPRPHRSASSANT